MMADLSEDRPPSASFSDEWAALSRATPPPSEVTPGNEFLMDAMRRAFELIRRDHGKPFHPNLIRLAAPIREGSRTVMTTFGNVTPAHFLIDTGMPFCTITKTQASIFRNGYRVSPRNRKKWFQYYGAGDAPDSGPLSLPEFKDFPTALIRLTFGPKLGCAEVPFFITDDKTSCNAIGLNCLIEWKLHLTACNNLWCACGNNQDDGMHLECPSKMVSLATQREVDVDIRPSVDKAISSPLSTPSPVKIRCRARPPRPLVYSRSGIFAPLFKGSDGPKSLSRLLPQPTNPPTRRTPDRRARDRYAEKIEAYLCNLEGKRNFYLNADPWVKEEDMHTQPRLPQAPLVGERAFIPLTTKAGEQGRTIKVLYDSGAQASILREPDFRALKEARVPLTVIPSKGHTLTAANGSPMKCTTVVLATLYTKTQPVTIPFFVCPSATTSILGINAIRQFDLVLDPINLVADVRRSADIAELAATEDLQVRVVKQQDVAALSGITKCKMELVDSQGNAILGERTAAINYEFECALVKVNARGRFKAPLSNPAYLERRFEAGEVVAGANDMRNNIYIDACEIRRVHAPSTAPAPKVAPHTAEQKADIRSKLTVSVKASVPYEHVDEMLKLLMEHEDVFSASSNDIGLHEGIEHTIDLRHNEPIFRPQYKLPAEHLLAIKNQTLAWEKLGIVQKTRSKYNNPIFAVPKPNGGLRIVLDFRGLNEATLDDRYCIPTVDEIMSKIGNSKAKWFSTLDLTSGFYHIPLRDRDRKFTAYTLPGMAQYEWCRASMGLKGSPSTFTRAITEILHDVEFCISYVDDLLCFTTDVPTHFATLRTILRRLRAGGFRVNPDKSRFLCKEIDYLGTSVSAQGIRPTLLKTKAVESLEPPTTVKTLRSILGFFNYMSQYLFNYSAKAGPLLALQKAGSTWKGGELPAAALDAFTKIKTELVSRPALGFITSGPDRHLHLYVDAALGGSDNNGKGFGAVLLQDTPGGMRRPVAYLSRTLQPHEENYPAGLAELKAATWAMQKLHHHLKHRAFYIYSDHKPLTNKLLGGCHKKTFAHCSTLTEDFYPVWRRVDGADNVIADFLSRYHGINVTRQGAVSANADLHVALVTHTAVNLLAPDHGRDRLRFLQRNDELCKAILTEVGGQCAQSTPARPIEAKSAHIKLPVTVWDGILMVKPARTGNAAPKFPPRPFRVLTPNAMRHELVVQAHGAHKAFSPHFGVDKTYYAIDHHYYWPNMWADCRKIVSECDVCLRATDKGTPPSPPATSSRVPPRPNHTIQLDLQGPVQSRTCGKKAFILGIIDSFSRHLTLRLIPNKKASSVAREICDYFQVMGTPRTILTDRGKEFNNGLNAWLLRLTGVGHAKTSAYHPQTNGLAEEANKTVQNYIRKAIDAHNRQRTDIDTFLLPCAWSYNTSRHSTTRITPYEATFGFRAREGAWEDIDDIFAGKANADLTMVDRISRHMQHAADYRRAAKQNILDHQEDDRERRDVRTGARSPNYDPRQPVLVERFQKGPVNPKFANKYYNGWIIRQVSRDVYVVFTKGTGRNARGTKSIHNAANIKPDTSPAAVYMSEEEHARLLGRDSGNTQNTDSQTEQSTDSDSDVDSSAESDSTNDSDTDDLADTDAASSDDDENDDPWDEDPTPGPSGSGGNFDLDGPMYPLPSDSDSDLDEMGDSGLPPELDTEDLLNSPQASRKGKGKGKHSLPAVPPSTKRKGGDRPKFKIPQFHDAKIPLRSALKKTSSYPPADQPANKRQAHNKGLKRSNSFPLASAKRKVSFARDTPDATGETRHTCHGSRHKHATVRNPLVLPDDDDPMTEADPVLGRLHGQPRWGTLRLPQKRGRRPYDEIERVAISPGRPRTTGKAPKAIRMMESIFHKQANLAATVLKTPTSGPEFEKFFIRAMKSIKGQNKIIKMILEGKLPITSEAATPPAAPTPPSAAAGRTADKPSTTETTPPTRADQQANPRTIPPQRAHEDFTLPSRRNRPPVYQWEEEKLRQKQRLLSQLREQNLQLAARIASPAPTPRQQRSPRRTPQKPGRRHWYRKLGTSIFRKSK